MTRPDATTYQRIRLWCGITGIGLILVLLWVAVGLGLPRAADGLFEKLPTVLAGFFTALLLGIGAALLQAGPDYYAARTELAYGQRQSGGLIGRYLTHVMQWLGGIASAGLLVGIAVALAGAWWWLPAVVLLLGLSFFHVVYPLSPTKRAPAPDADWWQRVEAELGAMNLPVPAVSWYDHGERSLAGGWNGVGPFRRLFLATSLAQVEPRVAAGLIAREVGHLRLRHRLVTMLCTAGWIVGGIVLAGWLAADDLGAAGVVVVLAATMSTWCWLGLLGLWPSLGKWQIYAADAFAADKLGRDDAVAMLDELATRNLPDPSLAAGVEFVFHPIPPMNKRRQRLLEGAAQ